MGADAVGYYDRVAASRILTGLASSADFLSGHLPAAAVVEYRPTPMQFEADGSLTLSQRLYLERFMQPCCPDQVTSATHRVNWVDADGVANTGHFRADGPGPIVPIAARAAFLALWHALRSDTDFGARVHHLAADDRAVLAATTTDHEPPDIFRVGIEATARALAQHALLAQHTPYRSAVDFAVAMRDADLFTAVATRWFWELQASTYRRGMIPVTLDGTGSRLRYSADTIATLRAMKDATISDAHAVMHQAHTAEGLSTEQAIAKYHDDLDLISRQYALLPAGTRPVCLASMPHRIGEQVVTVLPLVVDRFVEAFIAAVERYEIRALAGGEAPSGASGAESSFAVPDMNCKHCVRTIGAVLTSMDIPVHDIDLDTKTVHAEFRSPRNRERAFAALRDSGYNPTTAASNAKATD